MPLSFDLSPDGRVYVLDAGNRRIQAFDTDGDYLTQWSGEFGFGGGSVPSDFSGSIVVDDDGFIYVADVGNKRIQKFAP
jgi:tripartite motif-containing protein 71